ALLGVHDFISHRRLQFIISKLGASQGAPGPHAFAVRIDIARLTIPIRPSHPASNTRDDREAPLLEEAGRRELIMDFWETEVKYFGAKDWTAESALNPLAKIEFQHSIFTSL